MSTAPRWASACGPTSRFGRGASSVPATAAGPAVPAGRHPDAAVAEPGPVRCTPPGGPTGSAGTSCEADVQGVAARHPGGGPAARHAAQGRRLATANSRAPSVGGRRDQRVRADARPRAVLLGALQHASRAPCRAGRQRWGRAGSPPTRPSGCPARGARAAQLGQDRHRVGVPLAQPGQRQVLPGQVGEPGPALPGPPAAGQREVQPARLDRPGEGGRRDPPRGRAVQGHLSPRSLGARHGLKYSFVSHGSAASTRRVRLHSVWPRVSRRALRLAGLAAVTGRPFNPRPAGRARPST